ncbi:MAG: hypothetical protein Q8K66_13055 [Sediminibacterium sp.]|nr:hypothetical protein [Sediminibacterium sp.]MDP3128837.1 hypothetical protein [Sediminibacterium sp.]
MKKTITKVLAAGILLTAVFAAGYYAAKQKKITGNTIVTAKFKLAEWNNIFAFINKQVAQMDTVAHKAQRDSVAIALFEIGNNIDSVNKIGRFQK